MANRKEEGSKPHTNAKNREAFTVRKKDKGQRRGKKGRESRSCPSKGGGGKKVDEVQETGTRRGGGPEKSP